MKKGRLEAFSDGVVAIIITIMVLELKVPTEHHDNIRDLLPVLPVLLGYVLSFVYIGIYWNNHHHMLHAVNQVDGRILWANLHLLFWLSLIPFATAWMGRHELSAWPVALYGVVLLFAGVAYFILARLLAAHHGYGSTLANALGGDSKGKLSIAIYAAAIPLAFVSPRLAYALYAAVALMWLYPDRRFEKAFTK